jgi:DNA replication licensing factor MCM2
MVLADDGICLIDEFDKMNEQDRTSIHEAMEQQTISVSKAGIVATLQARCAVIAVANPVEGRYNSTQTFSQNVNLSDPILSRFDVLCVIKDESDPLQDERLADHVISSHIRSHPAATVNDKAVRPKLQEKKSHIEPIDQDLLKKYIIYARQRVKPQITDIDKDKLANFYKDIRAEAFRSGGAPMTARHIESIIRLAEASAKIELRQHVNSGDLDFAISIMLESFIQSQKHAIAEELRKNFRRYVTQATSLSDQFMQLLLKLFRDKAEDLASLGAEVVLSEVAVPMTDVVSRIERQDLDMNEATKFMRSDEFRQNFRLSGEQLYQIA